MRPLTPKHKNTMPEAKESLPHLIKKHKRGDIREDGKVFHHYYKSNGKLYEYWVSPEKFLLDKEKHRLYNRDRYRNTPKEKKTLENKLKHQKFKINPERVEKQRLARIAWQKRNKDKLNAKHKEKRDNDPIFATAHRIRRLTAFAFERKGYKKNGTAEQLLGCTWEQLKTHIESKFLPGMNWSNRHKWHVDHIIPLASAKTPEEVEDLCKWHNLQPLWKEDNLKKGAKLFNAHTAPESL